MDYVVFRSLFSGGLDSSYSYNLAPAALGRYPAMIPLHDGEQMLAVRRKSWFVFASTSTVAGLLLLTPILLGLILSAPKLSVLHGPWISLYILGSALIEWVIWLWLFTALLNYYLDVFIITNERIIHIEQKGLFHRSTSELRLSRVQDVQVEHRGFIETLFHFGTIIVQSAAERAGFVFELMDRPEEVKELIMSAHRKAIPDEYAQAHTLPPSAGEQSAPPAMPHA